MTTAIDFRDWDDISDAHERNLILSPSPTVWIGAELLNPDLTVAEDITDDLKITGDVHWQFDATVHRDASFTVARELDWGNALVRLSYSMSDPVTGFAARRYIGAFSTQTPDQVLGESVVGPDGARILAWSVTGQDRLGLLDRQVGSSYVLTSGQEVISGILGVLASAGETGYLIDGAAQGKTIPTDMTWPLIPGTVADAVDDGESGPTTWLQILNDLAKMCGYAPVWADHHGYFRFGPDQPATEVAPIFEFDALDPLTSSIGASRTRKVDVYGAPNKWIFIQDNLASGVPPVTGAGLYVKDNPDNGPSSIAGRGGRTYPTQISLTAIDQAALVAQGNARVAADMRSTATYTFTTPPFPPAGHRDVLRVTDVFGTTTVRATEWRLPLDGGPTEWTVEQIA